MPIKPEQIDPTSLPVVLRGYDRDITNELLKRVAWDYRQALRAQEERADNDRRLERRIEELEARLASEQAEFARAIAGREAREDADTDRRIAGLEAEVTVLRRKLHGHESRAELTRALLHAAQRASRDIRESARQDAIAVLRGAKRRAAKIEREANLSARHSSTEIDRLRRLENDLRDRLRHTLQAVIGENSGERAEAPKPPTDTPSDTWSSFDSH